MDVDDGQPGCLWIYYKNDGRHTDVQIWMLDVGYRIFDIRVYWIYINYVQIYGFLHI